MTTKNSEDTVNLMIEFDPNKPIIDWETGKAVPWIIPKSDDSDEREEGFITIGRVLLTSLARYQAPAGDGIKTFLSYRIGKAILEAMEQKRTYKGGPPAIKILREALAGNPGQWITMVTGQVWEVIGTGENENEPEIKT